MRKEKERMGGGGVRFLQSAGDFPLTVDLGGKVPAWGLSRKAGGMLRFVPPDDEGFTLRGDAGGSLVYRGRKRSHRFTILHDTAFEYDCILNREPDSNVVTLRMEGADGFDFFRQPEGGKDPFLKGSYAVYAKETPAGCGTGKLCHIRRPLVIDNRGRRVWGGLSVTGNTLGITIPEAWLAGASYPVVVDPAIGTAAVGSYTTWEQDGEQVPLTNELSIPVNRFLVNETVNGVCTAYVYAYSREEPESAGYPVLYSDSNNAPLTRLSSQESRIDLQVSGGKPAGWRSGTLHGYAAAGNYVWFGVSTEYFWYACFDYGAKMYGGSNADAILPDTYPLYSRNEYYNFKLSMYFDYSSAQAFTRTLTQGVTLTDRRNITGVYMRGVSHAAVGSGKVRGMGGFYRGVADAVKNTFFLKSSPLLIRSLVQRVGLIQGPVQSRAAFRRSVVNTAGNKGGAYGLFTFFRYLLDCVKPGDNSGSFITRGAVIRDTEGAGDRTGHRADYLRGLLAEAHCTAGTGHMAEYHRLQEDTAHNGGVSLRHVLVCIRLVTLSLVRDYVIFRFLRSRDEIVLKSKVTVELELESRI
jgi:hypothetical protein